MDKSASGCLTCNGAGEVGSESGPQPCPDCFGAGEALDRSTKVEWRLRRIEGTCHEWGRDAESAARWLAHELRIHRQALLQILTRCQDTDTADSTAQDVKYLANEALKLYEREER
jgi:hypothetical protein